MPLDVGFTRQVAFFANLLRDYDQLDVDDPQFLWKYGSAKLALDARI